MHCVFLRNFSGPAVSIGRMMADRQHADLALKATNLRLAAKRDASAGTFPAAPRTDPEAAQLPTLASGIVEVRVRLESEQGLIEARRQTREIAARGGFRPTDRAIITTAVAELGRNILLYAAPGDIVIKLVQEDDRVGIVITATDNGPGIADVARAMRDGFSTSNRLGIGLPGVRRLCDGFDIASAPNLGTTVVARKWRS